MAVSTMSISEDPYENLTSPDLTVYSAVGETSHNSSGAKRTVKSGKSSHPFRLAAVGLGLLCAILLTATIALCVLYTRERGLEMLNAQNSKDYEGQLQRDYINLSNEKDQLQRDYNSHIGQCRTCPEGWEQLSSKCYFFPSEPLSNGENWEDSRQYCKLQGAELVIVKSQEEQEFINQHTNRTFYWIGLKYSANGVFEWVDGTALQQAFWYHGHPSSSEHCVLTGYTLQLWINQSCNSTWSLICETAASCVCNKKLSK